jgi:hypothetical protein
MEEAAVMEEREAGQAGPDIEEINLLPVASDSEAELAQAISSFRVPFTEKLKGIILQDF